MALTAKSWRLNSYTVGTFTTLVTAVGAPVIKSIAVANGAGTPTISLRIVNASDVVQSILLTGETLAANASYVCDLPLIVLAAGEKLQVSASAAGASFTASGVE
jgi:hypothetical protein